MVRGWQDCCVAARRRRSSAAREPVCARGACSCLQGHVPLVAEQVRSVAGTFESLRRTRPLAPTDRRALSRHKCVQVAEVAGRQGSSSTTSFCDRFCSSAWSRGRTSHRGQRRRSKSWRQGRCCAARNDAHRGCHGGVERRRRRRGGAISHQRQGETELLQHQGGSHTYWARPSLSVNVPCARSCAGGPQQHKGRARTSWCWDQAPTCSSGRRAIRHAWRRARPTACAVTVCTLVDLTRCLCSLCKCSTSSTSNGGAVEELLSSGAQVRPTCSTALIAPGAACQRPTSERAATPRERSVPGAGRSRALNNPGSLRACAGAKSRHHSRRSSTGAEAARRRSAVRARAAPGGAAPEAEEREQRQAARAQQAVAALAAAVTVLSGCLAPQDALAKPK